jgi:hypothetical protein
VDAIGGLADGAAVVSRTPGAVKQTGQPRVQISSCQSETWKEVGLAACGPK